MVTFRRMFYLVVPNVARVAVRPVEVLLKEYSMTSLLGIGSGRLSWCVRLTVSVALQVPGRREVTAEARGSIYRGPEF